MVNNVEPGRKDDAVQSEAGETTCHMNRRRFVGIGLGALAALLGGSRRLAQATDDERRDVCYWETRSSQCSNGRRLEYRCEVCCAGGICETVRCGWFDVGPC